MPRLPDYGEVAGVPCDTCGEVDACVHLAEVSLCDACWEAVIQAHLQTLLGRTICGTIVWSEGENSRPAICAAPLGHGFHE